MRRLLWLVVLLTGCAQVVDGDENSVIVSGSDTGQLARQHCAQFGKIAVISAEQPAGLDGVRYFCF